MKGSKAARVVEAILDENSYRYAKPFDPAYHQTNLEMAQAIRRRVAEADPREEHLREHFLRLADALEAGTSSHVASR